MSGFWIRQADNGIVVLFFQRIQNQSWTFPRQHKRSKPMFNIMFGMSPSLRQQFVNAAPSMYQRELGFSFVAVVGSKEYRRLLVVINS